MAHAANLMPNESFIYYGDDANAPYGSKSEDEMMKVRNLGRKSLEEVLAKLKELGLQLNPSDEN